ncbi:hypothetical protein [Microtetraspora sp. NBRC 13810]|uniref:hypothetical protein n=1 Tax=Microtetraspora sp. NBRC 13810 TaxID=3030990 RepID=UPI00255757D6|nr:hypothetical protein [Microtetraspora sp. NBRC 13810]
MDTSCCGEYEWCCEGGQFLVLRRNGERYEETARGLYAKARPVWEHLIGGHRHRRSGQR